MLELLHMFPRSKNSEGVITLNFMSGAQENITIFTTFVKISVDVDGVIKTYGTTATGASNTIVVPASTQKIKVKILEITKAPGVLSSLGFQANRLIEVASWTNELTNSLTFSNCPNLVAVPSHLPNSITKASGMFYNCAKFNAPLNDWDMSRVTDTTNMLAMCPLFNQPLDRWKTTSLETMMQMFRGSIRFNQDIGSWDVSKVTSIQSAFNGCTDFNQPLNNWNTSSMQRMDNAFMQCSNFNQPLNLWNTSQVTNMTYILRECSKFNQDLSGWDVSKVSRSNRENYDYLTTAWQASFKPKFTG